MAELVKPVLAGSEFRVNGVIFGGACGSDGRELLVALGLGPKPLDPELPRFEDDLQLRIPVTLPNDVDGK